MTFLAAIFAKHGTDKEHPNGHSYAATYERLLAPYRELPRACALLEVGVLGGASLRAWREYLYPNWRVVGIDNNLTCGDIPGVELYQADSTDAQSVAAVLGASRFDVIVDDGGHALHEQSPTWDNLQSYLNPGGLAVVEDLQSGEAAAWFADRGFVIHNLNHERPGSWDNVLAAYRKPMKD